MTEMPAEGLPQLTIDGREVSTAQAIATSTAGPRDGMSDAQRLILARIRRDGSLRAVEAGVIAHECRRTPCRLAGAAGADRFKGTRGVSCCAYASTDGAEALKRMRDRGLVEQHDDRRWYLVEPTDFPTDNQPERRAHA